MTPEQLEATARKLCEIRGENPDRLIAHGAEPDENGFARAILLHSPCWQFAAKEIRAHLEIQEAINSIPQPSPYVIIKQGQDGVPPEVIEGQWRNLTGL